MAVCGWFWKKQTPVRGVAMRTGTCVSFGRATVLTGRNFSDAGGSFKLPVSVGLESEASSVESCLAPRSVTDEA